MDKVISAQDFWSDQNNAKTIMSKLDGLKNLVFQWQNLNEKANELSEIEQLLETETDEELSEQLQKDTKKLETEIKKLDIKTKLS